MFSKAFRCMLALAILGGAAAQVHATTIQTIIANIKKNTAKITKFSAEIPLKENATGTCTVRNARWTYARPDTIAFALKQDTGWMTHCPLLSIYEGDFPKYEAIFLLPLLADTFPNSWFNADIPTFTATVTSEDNDSIVLQHMNSSVFFNYTVDKKRWLVTRVNANGYDIFDVNYTWSVSNNSVYYPSAIRITQADLCEEVYPLTNIKLNGTVMASVRDPHDGRNANRSANSSLTLKALPGARVAIALPAGYTIRSVSIIDAVGRIVWKALGKNRTITWDGKSLANQPVRNGLYVVDVTTDRGHASGKGTLTQ
jgi:hypothetical protein